MRDDHRRRGARRLRRRVRGFRRRVRRRGVRVRARRGGRRVRRRARRRARRRRARDGDARAGGVVDVRVRRPGPARARPGFLRRVVVPHPDGGDVGGALERVVHARAELALHLAPPRVDVVRVGGDPQTRGAVRVPRSRAEVDHPGGRRRGVPELLEILGVRVDEKRQRLGAHVRPLARARPRRGLVRLRRQGLLVLVRVEAEVVDVLVGKTLGREQAAPLLLRAAFLRRARARRGDFAASSLLRARRRQRLLLLLGGFGGRLAAALRGASGAFRFRARRRLLGVGGLGIRRFLGGARSRRRPRRRRLFARLLDRRFAVLLDRRFAVLPDRLALGPGRDVPLGRFDPRRSHDLAEALRPRAGEHTRTLLPPLASSRARPPGGAAAAAPGASRGLGVPVADEERERGSRVRRRLELLELLLVVVVVVVIVIVVVGVPLLLLLLLLAQTADVAALLLRAPPRLRRLVPLRRPLVVVLPGVVPHPGGGSGGFFAGGGGGAEGRLALPETSRRRARRRRARHRVDHLRVRLLARGGGARLEVQVRLQERRDGLVVLLELEDVLARARVHGLREEVAVLVAVRGDGVDLLERELRLARQPGAYVVLALRRADDALVQTPNQVVVLHQGQVVVQKPAEGVARRGEFVRLEAGFVAVLRAQAVVGVAAHAETVVDDA